MKAPSSAIKNSFKPALAATMVVWLSGLLFLVCCGQVNAHMAAKDSCPMASTGGHCDKDHTSAPTVSDESTEQCADCAYLPVVFNKYSKFEKTANELARPESRLSISFAAPAIKVVPIPVSAIERVSYEPKFLVKNCVLRI